MPLLFTVGLENPVGRRRAHREQLLATLLREVQMLMPLQRLHQSGQKRNEPLGTDVVGCRPGQVQGLLDFQAVVGCPRTLNGHLGSHRMP